MKSLSTQASKAFHREKWGSEPIVESIVLEHGTLYSDILTWYSCMADRDQAREYLYDFFSDEPEILASLKNVPDSHINTTAAAISRLMMRGATLPDSSIDFFQTKVEEMLTKVTDDGATPIVNVRKVNVQDHIKEKAITVISELEGMIDDGLIDLEWSLYDHLQKNNISAIVAAKIVDHFKPIAAELIEAVTGDDESLKEGYARLDEDEMLLKTATYQTLLEDAIRYCDGSKKARKPRKKKVITTDKLLKTFNYAKESNEYQLKSINPERIIGAQELWTFNMKYKALAVYRAIDKGGLSVRGTSIHKYDEKTSCQKAIGRKTEERIQEVLTGGKIALRKIMDSINGDARPVMRINDATILLRVVT